MAEHERVAVPVARRLELLVEHVGRARPVANCPSAGAALRLAHLTANERAPHVQAALEELDEDALDTLYEQGINGMWVVEAA